MVHATVVHSSSLSLVGTATAHKVMGVEADNEHEAYAGGTGKQKRQ